MNDARGKMNAVNKATTKSLSATFNLFAATCSRMLSIPGILRLGKGLLLGAAAARAGNTVSKQHQAQLGSVKMLLAQSSSALANAKQKLTCIQLAYPDAEPQALQHASCFEQESLGFDFGLQHWQAHNEQKQISLNITMAAFSIRITTTPTTTIIIIIVLVLVRMSLFALLCFALLC